MKGIFLEGGLNKNRATEVHVCKCLEEINHFVCRKKNIYITFSLEICSWIVMKFSE